MNLCSAERLAQLFHVTARRVQQLARDGVIPAALKPGLYDQDGCIMAYVRYLQERAAGRGQPKELDEQKQKLLDARLEKARLEASRLAGRLISLDEVAGVNERACRAAAAHFTSLGARLRSELARLSDPADIQKRIDDETRAIIEDLASALASGTRAAA